MMCSCYESKREVWKRGGMGEILPLESLLNLFHGALLISFHNQGKICVFFCRWFHKEDIVLLSCAQVSSVLSSQIIHRTCREEVCEYDKEPPHR